MDSGLNVIFIRGEAAQINISQRLCFPNLKKSKVWHLKQRSSNWDFQSRPTNKTRRKSATFNGFKRGSFSEWSVFIWLLCSCFHQNVCFSWAEVMSAGERYIFMRRVMTLYECLLQDGVLARRILQGTQIKPPLWARHSLLCFGKALAARRGTLAILILPCQKEESTPQHPRLIMMILETQNQKICLRETFLWRGWRICCCRVFIFSGCFSDTWGAWKHWGRLRFNVYNLHRAHSFCPHQIRIIVCKNQIYESKTWMLEFLFSMFALN